MYGITRHYKVSLQFSISTLYQYIPVSYFYIMKDAVVYPYITVYGLASGKQKWSSDLQYGECHDKNKLYMASKQLSSSPTDICSFWLVLYYICTAVWIVLFVTCRHMSIVRWDYRVSILRYCCALLIWSINCYVMAPCFYRVIKWLRRRYYSQISHFLQ